jgi:hypothetical protein
MTFNVDKATLNGFELALNQKIRLVAVFAFCKRLGALEECDPLVLG